MHCMMRTGTPQHAPTDGTAQHAMTDGSRPNAVLSARCQYKCAVSISPPEGEECRLNSSHTPCVFSRQPQQLLQALHTHPVADTQQHRHTHVGHSMNARYSQHTNQVDRHASLWHCTRTLQ